MKNFLKHLIEEISGAKIYRNSLPRGVSVSHDIRLLYNQKVETIWDIGAHRGESALEFAREFPNALIKSFEPVSLNYLCLVENCRHLKNHSAHQLAFGDSSKEVKMFLQDGSVINSLREDLNVASSSEQNHELVKQHTVDSFLSSDLQAKIDLMKIDVEGYELAVLNGAKECLEKKKASFIYLETGLDSRFNTLETIVAALNPYGYLPYAFYEQNPHWTGKQNLWYWNTLFVNESLL